MDRRRKNVPGGRQIRHVVKLSEREEKALQAKANQAGISVSRLLVEAALGETPEVARRVWTNELLAIRYQLVSLAEQDKFDPDRASNLAAGIDKFLDGAG